MKSATDKNGAFSPDDVNIYRQMPGVSAEERLVRDEAAWNALVDTAFGKTVSETDD